MDSNLYGAFPVKWSFLVFAGSLFGAGTPFFVPSPAIRFAERAEGVQGTETVAKLGGLPPSGAASSRHPSRWRRLWGDLIGFQECRRQSQVRTKLTAGESGVRYLTFRNQIGATLMTDSHNRFLGNRALSPETLMMSYGYDPFLSERSLKPPIFQTRLSSFDRRRTEKSSSSSPTACGKSARMKSPD